MKFIHNIIIAVLLSFCLVGCVENDPEYENFPGDDIAFSYKVSGDYVLDYLVGSTIDFTNISALSGNASWDFGDGTPAVSGNEVSHIYQVAGSYKVTMLIEGQGKLTQDLMISDIFPTVTVDPIAGGICEVNTTPVHFSVSLPNPQSLTVEYTWLFPDGTKDQNGNPITESALEDPGTLKFSNIGSQRIVLKTKLGGRQLQDGVLNVQVGYNAPAKTIYYAVKGGNIMALKLIPTLPAGMKNNPFDMGVKSGQHPLNVVFSDSSLYILDAGKQFYYINDVDGNMGDGAISVLAKDGSKLEIMMTNKTAAFSDPFYGYADDTYLYFGDRNTGITRLNKSERNLALDRTNAKFAYYVQNDRLLYYNSTYSFGAMNACMTKLSDGTWWWSKTFNGVGIFRFKDSDISPTPISAGQLGKPYPVLVDGIFIKSFAVDEKRGMVYYAVRDKGFYKATFADFTNPAVINPATPGTLVQAMISDSEGATGEYIDISQMALDPDDGCVYFGYRKDPTSVVLSGLKRYNPATNRVESVIDNVDIYGVSINHNKSKLF